MNRPQPQCTLAPPKREGLGALAWAGIALLIGLAILFIALIWMN